MAYLIDAGLLLMTLVFGILGVWTFNVREKANIAMISKHLTIQWQDMKSNMPPPTYGLSFVYLIIAFICLMGFIVTVTVLK